ncbi:hypothetical protein EJ04DRAFT_577789 [Polyplosphaeria fusca]|uniref:Uncharacterized protein n=1 Tax=Polyplosphaeria fusca TaxID=682080 RepID=A0A9P4QYC7_9PLEO|nr:hypothetical protein EJ04DRAFT_577789 [Polyplosphaeria fusca]
MRPKLLPRFNEMYYRGFGWLQRPSLLRRVVLRQDVPVLQVAPAPVEEEYDPESVIRRLVAEFPNQLGHLAWDVLPKPLRINVGLRDKYEDQGRLRQFTGEVAYDKCHEQAAFGQPLAAQEGGNRRGSGLGGANLPERRGRDEEVAERHKTLRTMFEGVEAEQKARKRGREEMEEEGAGFGEMDEVEVEREKSVKRRRLLEPQPSPPSFGRIPGLTLIYNDRSPQNRAPPAQQTTVPPPAQQGSTPAQQVVSVPAAAANKTRPKTTATTSRVWTRSTACRRLHRVDRPLC